jgi:DNA-directed RNA polymerase subunit RPC12/RpoP
MHPEIENLINMALADGEVTDKERAIILRKAESLGLDKDEIEMILDGKIALLRKEQNYTQQSISSNSQKEGGLKKCPSCGSPVLSFQTNCSDCGHEFSNIEANASIHKLFKMIEEVENQRKDDGMNLLKEYFSEIMGGVGDKVNNRKKDIIRNFPIPNTKEDIIEFLSLALPNARKAGNFFTSGAFNSPANHRNRLHNEFVQVWYSKCEQIIMKARFSMKDDKKTLEEIEYYAKQLGIK